MAKANTDLLLLPCPTLGGLEPHAVHLAGPEGQHQLISLLDVQARFPTGQRGGRMTPAQLAVDYASRDLVTLTMAMIAGGAAITHFILSGSPLPFIRDHRQGWIKAYDTILFFGWLAAFLGVSIAHI